MGDRPEIARDGSDASAHPGFELRPLVTGAAIGGAQRGGEGHGGGRGGGGGGGGGERVGRALGHLVAEGPEAEAPYLNDPEARARADAEREWLSERLLGRGILYASMVKAAEGAWQVVTHPSFSRWLLASSAALVHDETGPMPSVYDGRAPRGPRAARGEGGGGGRWVVRRYGNFSALERLAYPALAITERWGRAGGSTGPLPTASPDTLAMREELHTRFDGSSPLPLLFGYGKGWEAPGVMLVAWRSGDAGGATGKQ